MNEKELARKVKIAYTVVITFGLIVAILFVLTMMGVIE